MLPTTASNRPAIGVIIPWLGSADHIQILEGVRRVVAPRGYHVVALQAGFAVEGRFHNDIFSSTQHRVGTARMAGWVLMNIPGMAPWIRHQIENGRPVVQVSPATTEPLCPAVAPDNTNAAQALVAHLIGHGHTKIAFIGNLANSDIAARYTGYAQALEQAGLTHDDRLVISIDWRGDFWTAEAGAAAAHRLMASGVSWTALFAATDELARGARDALANRGWFAPQQYALVGFDDAPIARTMDPPLTTAHQSFPALGMRAAELLLAQIDDGVVPELTTDVPSQVQIRSSCGCVPAYLRTSAPPSLGEAPLDLFVSCILATATPDDHPDVAHVRAASTDLVAAFEVAVHDGDIPRWAPIVRRAIQRLVTVMSDADRLHSGFLCLRDNYLARQDASTARILDVVSCAERILIDVFVRSALVQENRWSQLTTSASDIVLQMLGQDVNQLLNLRWLKNTSIEQGYLLLFPSAGNADEEGFPLHVAGVYSRIGTSQLTVGASVSGTAFPPPEVLADITTGDLAEDVPLTIFPVSTASHLYGILCVTAPRHDAVYHSSTAGVWAAQIAVQFELESLVSSLREQGDQLAAAFEHERTLTRVVRDLSCPVLPVGEGVIILPLIGIIDSQRAEQILEGLLNGIVMHRAKAVVMDITGVPIVDTQVAAYLLRAVQAARLLGAKVVLTGVSPEIAQTVVQLGMDMSGLTTQADLAGGIRYAMRQR